MASYLSLVKSQAWKPPVQLFDCSVEYLKHCPIDYNGVNNPFSSKSRPFEPEQEAKIWQSLGIVHSVTEQKNNDETQNPFHATSVAPIHSKREQKRIRRAERQNTLTQWYDMHRPETTAEDMEDLEVIRMRQAIATDTHVRRADTKIKFFQRGVVVDDPGSFYDRIPRKQRRKTLVDELLTNAEIVRKQRRRYAKVERSNAERRAAVQRQKQQRLKRLKEKPRRSQATVVVPTPQTS